MSILHVADFVSQPVSICLREISRGEFAFPSASHKNKWAIKFIALTIYVLVSFLCVITGCSLVMNFRIFYNLLFLAQNYLRIGLRQRVGQARMRLIQRYPALKLRQSRYNEYLSQIQRRDFVLQLYIWFRNNIYTKSLEK